MSAQPQAAEFLTKFRSMVEKSFPKPKLTGADSKEKKDKTELENMIANAIATEQNRFIQDATEHETIRNRWQSILFQQANEEQDRKRIHDSIERQAIWAVRDQLLKNLAKAFKMVNPGKGLDLPAFVPGYQDAPKLSEIEKILSQLHILCVNYTKENFKEYLQTKFIEKFLEHLNSKLQWFKSKYNWHVETQAIQFVDKIEGFTGGLEFLFEVAKQKNSLYELGRIEFPNDAPKEFTEKFKLLLTNYQSTPAVAGASSGVAKP